MFRDKAFGSASHLGACCIFKEAAMSSSLNLHASYLLFSPLTSTLAQKGIPHSIIDVKLRLYNIIYIQKIATTKIFAFHQ
jgi:hypothetical protein